MNAEELKQLKELIEFLKDHQVGGFRLERGDLKVALRFGPEPREGAAEPSADLNSLLRLLSAQQGAVAQPTIAAPVAAAPQAAAPAAPVASAPVDENAGLHIVKSPIVGTFYESSAPGASAFVKIGDRVENGQVLCIVEAMKLMNEIESDAAGEVVKRLVQNGQPVEYGQPLFALKVQ